MMTVMIKIKKCSCDKEHTDLTLHNLCQWLHHCIQYNKAKGPFNKKNKSIKYQDKALKGLLMFEPTCLCKTLFWLPLQWLVSTLLCRRYICMLPTCMQTTKLCYLCGLHVLKWPSVFMMIASLMIKKNTNMTKNMKDSCGSQYVSNNIQPPSIFYV